MTNKLLIETVFDTVVIKTWMIPGPGDDVDNPRWLSSYAIQGAPAVQMRGEGVDCQEEAALQALNAVQGILKAQIERMPPRE